MNFKPTRKHVIIGIGVVVAMGLFTYCSRPQPKPHLIAFVDTSASDRSALPRYETNLADLYDYQAATKSPITCYRFDANLQCFYNGPALGDADDVRDSFHSQLAPMATADNTYTDLVVRELERRMATEHTATVVVLDTSGFSEGVTAAGHRRIRHSAAILAKNKYLAGVVIQGARRQTWATITEDFAPLIKSLNGRFIIRSDTDFQSTTVIELIQTAQEVTEGKLKKCTTATR